MIPLFIFFFIWLALVILISIASLITVSILLRYGLSGASTVTLAIIFCLVPTMILLGAVSYFFTVDWSASLNILPSFGPLF
jgi:TRAP-type C4-dicarboxylate transport system permease small subunit